MTVPQIVKRKILVIRKPGGGKQYLITLPKAYATELEKCGISSFLVIFNKGLGAFPKIPGFTEKALLTFMSKHPELMELFSQTEAEQT